jgi:hypothetical protein
MIAVFLLCLEKLMSMPNRVASRMLLVDRALAYSMLTNL